MRGRTVQAQLPSADRLTARADRNPSRPSRTGISMATIARYVGTNTKVASARRRHGSLPSATPTLSTLRRLL